jgi:hypothetical protein
MTLGRGTVRSGNGPPPTKPLRRESIGPDSFGPPSVRTLLPLPRETLGPDSSAKRGIRFLGRRNIRRQSRHASPRTREPHFDISPRHACKDKWLRIERLLREGDWLDAYEDAPPRLARRQPRRRLSLRHQQRCEGSTAPASPPAPVESATFVSRPARPRLAPGTGASTTSGWPPEAAPGPLAAPASSPQPRRSGSATTPLPPAAQRDPRSGLFVEPP